ncbi:CDP-glycerol glycerophosphotransferase family protein [Scandinavium sp. H11S7]|uniref:CDP-glycerol glycerophosphotransferase family protein n=1 Tax=Scandinavium hiltneri TaxID=2926519 RepID=UPI0021653D6A|nr:CDP-glycerol glycerophosphotransferase family protein [Scandinavium hiltneri]MCS2156062.1 CDP-glycerol glycerophosphotransferase family protein [Scandinavium hiltneri]
MLNKFSLVLRFPFSLIGCLIPKNKRIWVFGAWFGGRFADNSKYFYHYLNNKGNIKAVWIYKDKKMAKYFLDNKLEAYFYRSIKGIWFQLIASKAFVSHSISSDLNPLAISINTQRIQLWHGVPLKKIMYDNPLERKWWNKNKLFKLVTNNFYHNILSPCSVFNDIFSSAFDVPREKILDSGYPRNDVFIKSKLKGKNKNLNYKAIYMPTYRSDEKSKDLLFSKKCRFDYLKLLSVLTEYSIELTIRVHPANLPPLSLMSKLKELKYLKISSADDVYEEIEQYDCLITDYSSILFDFALTSKPIIFAAFDLKDYLSDERSLYHPYQDISGGMEVNDWDELLQKLVMFKENPGHHCYGAILQDFTDRMRVQEGTCFSEILYTSLYGSEEKL